MTDHHARLIKSFDEQFSSLSTDPLYMLGGSLVLQRTDRERYFVVRSIMSFGVIKYAVKLINSIGVEGSGAYFEFSDTAGLRDYVEARMRQIFTRNVPNPTVKFSEALKKADSEMHWVLSDASGTVY